MDEKLGFNIERLNKSGRRVTCLVPKCITATMFEMTLAAAKSARIISNSNSALGKEQIFKDSTTQNILRFRFENVWNAVKRYEHGGAATICSLRICN